MYRTETRFVITCDRCTLTLDQVERPHGWLIVDTYLTEATNANVEYALCPSCREEFAAFMANGSANRPVIERLADILYPMDGYADDQWNGGDVCEALALLLDEVAPWAKTRQPERPEDAFEAYRAERERLGL